MIPRGSRGILAVSGGADSMCLMHVLHRIGEEMDLCLTVCHVIHGIRGEEAEEDAAFVRETAERLGLECRIFRRDVPRLAEEEGLSTEEAGRKARYACFEELREETGADWIALAHQMDDQAETVLFHILRGTGLRGLRGMQPVRERYVRPLLPFSREEIEAWLRSEGLEWRTDSTNLESEYARNRLRNLILPELCRVNSGAKEHLLLLAKEAEELYDIQEAETDLLRDRCRYTAEDGTVLSFREWEESGKPLMRVDIPDVPEEPGKGTATVTGELFLQELARLAGQRKDLTRKHILAVQELWGKETGKRVDLPYGLEAVRTHRGITLRKHASVSPTEKPELQLHVERREYLPGEEIPAGEERKMIDAAAVKGMPRLRTPMPGDRIMIDGRGSTKPLNRFFTDRKIPAEERTDWPVVADEEKILWVVGLRLSECCKVTEATKEIYLLYIGE